MTDEQLDAAADRAAERVDLRRPPRQVQITIHGWYPIVIIGLVLTLLTVGNVAYTIHLDRSRADSEKRARAAVVAAERKADQRWCQLLVPLDENYQVNPNVQATEIGRRVAAAVHAIRVETGC